MTFRASARFQVYGLLVDRTLRCSPSLLIITAAGMMLLAVKAKRTGQGVQAAQNDELLENTKAN